jgi:hypothetical protein
VNRSSRNGVLPRAGPLHQKIRELSRLGSEQKRVTVSVRKIHATFAKLAADEVNPSDTQEILRTVQQAFSGYVHGAYPHIMELYGGNPPRFHTSGMPNTPTIAGWEKQLIGYAYRAIMITALVARKLKFGHLHLDAIMRQAARRLPVVSEGRDWAKAGALITYGADYHDMWKHGAIFVDKILKGAKPGDLPIEQPTKFDLIVNMRAAKVLGITIPQSILLRADEVIR